MKEHRCLNCHFLLCKTSDELTGTVEIKCPKCNQMNTMIGPFVHVTASPVGLVLIDFFGGTLDQIAESDNRAPRAPEFANAIGAEVKEHAGTR